MQVFVFPGQGSQSKGMGADLFDSITEFTSVETDIDAILGYSVRELCLEDPDDQLNLTQFTQPALFVVNALYYYQKQKGQKQKDQQRQNGVTPDYLAGHSLGEYNALLAAGAFDLVTGVKLVQKRGELMGRAKDGGMAAVVGLDSDKISGLLEQQGMTGVDVANYNSPSQTVISGPVAELEQGAAAFKEAGAKLYKVLPVSAAFHSRYMQPAADEFRACLENVDFNPLQTPVVANVTGEPYPQDDPAAIPDLLARQISSSVQWTRSIRYLKGLGDAAFTEVGPGKVLARLIKQID